MMDCASVLTYLGTGLLHGFLFRGTRYDSSRIASVGATAMHDIHRSIARRHGLLLCLLTSSGWSESVGEYIDIGCESGCLFERSLLVIWVEGCAKLADNRE